MDAALQAFRRGPPQPAVVPTPSPPASEFVLRASILRFEKFQGRIRISIAPTDQLVGRRAQQSCALVRPHQGEPSRAAPEKGRQS